MFMTEGPPRRQNRLYVRVSRWPSLTSRTSCSQSEKKAAHWIEFELFGDQSNRASLPRWRTANAPPVSMSVTPFTLSDHMPLCWDGRQTTRDPIWSSERGVSTCGLNIPDGAEYTC